MDGSHDNAASKKSSVIIGRQPVVEAIEAGRAIDKILLQANTTGDIIGRIRQLAREHLIPIQVVPPEKLHTYTRAHHQGCIALAAMVNYKSIEEVIATVQAAGQKPLFVMLDGVTDVRNIGGIARSAVCCGAQALIIPDKGVGAINEEAVKSSAGALEHIQVCRVGSLLKTIDDLHHHGITVLVSAMGQERKLHELDLSQPCCLVVGSESKGVQPYLARAADERFSIPMAGNFDSFNVSVATGIILYEAMRQRF